MLRWKYIVNILSLQEFHTSQKRKSHTFKIKLPFICLPFIDVDNYFALFARPDVRIDLVVTENAVSMYKSSNIY